MNDSGRCIVLLALTLVVSPALGDVTPYSYALDGSNVEIAMQARIYEGEGTSGALVYDEGASVAGEGAISGRVNHSGSVITSIEIDAFTLQIAEPMYFEGYAGDVHIETYMDSFGWIADPATLSVDPGGEFLGLLFMGTMPGSQITLTVGDLLTFDLCKPEDHYPKVSGCAAIGSVVLGADTPVISMVTGGTYEGYLGDLAPGLDYTGVLIVEVSVSVPEPASLGVVGLAGLGLLRRRRA